MHREQRDAIYYLLHRTEYAVCYLDDVEYDDYIKYE